MLLFAVSCFEIISPQCRRLHLMGASPVRRSAKRQRSADAVGDRSVVSSASPFPEFPSPSPSECRGAAEALARLHGHPTTSQGASGPRKTVLDHLVRTVLSQNTTDTTSQRAFSALKARFPTWEEVRAADSGVVEDAIRVGGLAEIKASRIRAILDTLVEERGECTLEYVRDMDTPSALRELTRFKGVGPKTASCVLLFGMGRAEFPVDTHVWRISRSLRWAPSKATREETYLHLNERVPEDVKYELHVLLVEHGKRCPRCAKGGKNRQSSHGECPLTADNLRLWRDGLGAKGAGGGGAAGGIAAKEEDCKVGVGPLSEGPGEGALPLKDEGARKGRRLD